MAYVLGQYNKNKTVPDDNIFMTLMTEGTNRRRPVSSDEGVSGTASLFVDECCYVAEGFSIYTNYYFHGKIKRMTSAQTFSIKLVNFEEDPQEGRMEQFVKKINVAAGDIHEWVDVEFTFSPLANFDTILFELQRTVQDYREETRYPLIAYQELSRIENLISARIVPGMKLIKIGVQSHPGLMMCINGEEIHIPRTGVYELKNGLVLVSFFSIMSPAKEVDNTLIDWINSVNDQVDYIIAQLEEGLITPEEAEAMKAAINSRCFFATSKTRTIDSFTLDYMYKEEE